MVVGCHSFSIASMYEVEVSHYVIIQNSKGEFRIVFDFDLPDRFEDFDIEIAKLNIPFGPIDEIMEVHLFPVSTAWSPEYVDWNTPWHNPGGDYDDTLGINIYALRDNGAGNEAIFNVTEVLQLIQHGITYQGFVLMPPPYEKVGFESHLLSYFQAVAGIRLNISTRQ